MSVLVLIVNHNCQEMTVECVKSMKAFVKADMRFAIADNGSRDEVLSLKETLNEDKVFRLGENQGLAAGINELLAKLKPAAEQKILILNPDTFCSDDFLTPLLDLLDSDDSIGAVCPTIKTTDDRVWYGGGSFSYLKGGPMHHRDQTARIPQSVSFATACALLTTMDKYTQAGGLPIHYFLYFEDAHLSLRLQQRGQKLLWHPGSVLYHHVSATTDPRSPLYVYLFARNRMWLMREVTPSLVYVLFLFTHLLVRLPAALIYFGLFQQRGKPIEAFILGIEDGFKKPHLSRDPRSLFEK